MAVSGAFIIQYSVINDVLSPRLLRLPLGSTASNVCELRLDVSYHAAAPALPDLEYLQNIGQTVWQEISEWSDGGDVNGWWSGGWGQTRGDESIVDCFGDESLESKC